MDQSALFTITYGVYVLTTEVDGKMNGCIINTLSQVTQEPMRVSITVLKENFTNELIEKSNKFSVSVVDKNGSLDTIAHFGYRSGRDVDKFKDMPYVLDELNNPVVEKDCIATLSCKVIKSIDLGTHNMFIAEVVNAKKINDEEPMTYANYRDLKSGKLDQNKEKQSDSKEKAKDVYQCSVCHYIYDGDINFEDLPDDYVCPICKKPKSAFFKVN
ncbi:flavin reductase [Clostridium taeniosporum]|uniref:Flavin reductase n=1 Tax=Clostridium taeniosporum TaxID=394958 RepID=A0A1D7XIZ1_9CLOT|nr:flavin reductase [Clostridium taeniosporum]AOR23059.1 flavin reductase [Clostridium taeniosporum]